MKLYYDISNTAITKASHVTFDNQSKWTSFLLVLQVSLQCFSIVHQSWYVLHIDVDTCMTCGKMVSSFGMLLENEQLEGASPELTADSDVFNDVIYENNFTVEGMVHLYVGLWTTRLCLKNYKACFNPWLSGTKTIFEQTPFINDILESVYESRPFVLSALIATVITFVFARFLQVSSRSRAASLTVLSSTISGILTMLSFVIAGIPYMTSVSRSYIRLSPPWGLFATLVAGYVSFVIAYRVKAGTNGSKTILLRHWGSRQL